MEQNNERKTTEEMIQGYIDKVITKMTESSNERITKFDKVSNAIFDFSKGIFSKPENRQFDILIIFYGMIVLYSFINSVIQSVRSIVVSGFYFIVFCLIYALALLVYIFLLIARFVVAIIDLFRGESDNE
jgi:hypothetical protein